MSMVLPSMLCLGTLPPPLLTAVPGTMVPRGTPVMILCRGPAEAEAYVLSRVRSPEPLDSEKQLLSKKTNTWSITGMTPYWAGLYHCSYQSGGSWSQFSDPLQLVMTRAYDKPSLSSMTGIMALSGENVKLRCFSTLKFDAFILMKKDGVHIIQNQISTLEGGGHQAVFLLNQVSSTQTGTYRCYGVFSRHPYVWSHPSDRLQLWVTEASDDPGPTNPGPSPEFPDEITTLPTMTGGMKEHTAWHLSAENQVRLSMAGLILFVLVVLLAEAWYSQKMPFNGHRQAPT
ncbi:leukocyte immunoglobulin-like receptor subfamily A member 5 isoform X2 [Equus asinus]|uniref:Immunoglobulin-like beta-sandwich domain-containing protein n=1 Tax=Equus asinus TaxID=9793 RepID=A0A9L0K5G8_EQUAS|nr:leukocyte immunoglobulin-like receptor subfamily A member 5 isoform X3 [Equus asinus]